MHTFIERSANWTGGPPDAGTAECGCLPLLVAYQSASRPNIGPIRQLDPPDKVSHDSQASELNQCCLETRFWQISDYVR
jgi:hypothetical protein